MCIAAVGAGLLWKWTQEELQVLGWAGGAQPKAEDNHPGGGHCGDATREALAGFCLIPVGWLAVSAGSNQSYQLVGIFPFPRTLAAQGVQQHPPRLPAFSLPLGRGVF